MKRFVLFCSAALVATACLHAFAQKKDPEPRKERPTPHDRFIVELQPDAGDASEIVQLAGGKVMRSIERYKAVGAKLPPHVVEELKHNPRVRSVEPDPQRFLLQTPSWNDVQSTGEVKPYGLQMVQADQITTSGSAGIRRVCIIDSGYAMGHEDLPSSGVTANSDSGSGDPFVDGLGHGSHVAGTIAAFQRNGKGVRGIVPEGRLRLHIVKVFNAEGEWVYSSDLAHAIERCRAAGANVINMSLGGPYASDLENRAMADAYNAGILLVAAAGNNGDYSVNYPAGYSSVISVAAVDNAEALASFSQRNSDVELAAPGVSVISTVPYNTYDYYSGTSMATPHVSGVAALVWSYDTSRTNVQIRDILQRSAKDRGTAGRDTAYGFGIVQAKAALDRLGVDTQPPQVTLAHPVAGEKLFSGSPYTIQWSASDNRGLASFTVSVSTNGGASYTTLSGCGSLSASSRSCVWSSPAPLTSTARIQVVAKDTSGNTAKAVTSGNMSIAAGSPWIKVNSPNTAVTWNAGTVQTIQWSHDLASVSSVNVDLSRDGGVSWSRLASNVKNSSSSAGSFSWNVQGAASTAARVRVAWAEGNAKDVSDVNFKISGTSTSSGCAVPTVDGINICSPAAGASVGSPVSVNARAKVSGTIYRFELWTGGVKVASVSNSNAMQQAVSLSVGSRQLTFVAVNTAGATIKKAVTITVK